MTCSMSRKGNCWDNAPTESWFNRFKNEQVHGIHYVTHAQMQAAAFEYIEVFYNRKRLHSTLSYKSLIRFLENWSKEQQQENLVDEPHPLADEKPREPQFVFLRDFHYNTSCGDAVLQLKLEPAVSKADLVNQASPLSSSAHQPGPMWQTVVF